MHKSFDSKALKANLEQTKIDDIIISADEAWFVALSESHWGIHKRAKEFIIEYNHPYVNYDYILENLHEISLTDLWFYNALEEAEKSLIFLLEIFADLLQKELEESQEEQLIKTLFKFTDKLAREVAFPNSAIRRCISLIKLGMENKKIIFLRNSGYFRTYFSQIVTIPEFSEEIYEMTKNILLKSCEYWENTSKAEEWFASKKELFQASSQETIRFIGEDFFMALKTNIENSENWDELQSNLFFSDIANHFRNFSAEFQHPIEKIYYIFYAIQVPGMLHLRNYLLYDLNHQLNDVLVELSKEEIPPLITNLFSLFKELKAEHAGIILDCLLTLGKQIAIICNQELVAKFNTKLIDFGFISPGVPVVNEDWQTKIDENHVKNIRIWLELIEFSPIQFKKLLSALVVNLGIGGIFISDTDLFQRDITKLLNSEIAPVYKQVKQLAKIFPVYFQEIGAEGRLREVSTAMDELSRRKDLLVHFARKQIHTESNNTHIALIKNILIYWSSGDSKLLLPLLPKDIKESLDLESEFYLGVHKMINLACEALRVDINGFLSVPLQELEKWLDNCSFDYKHDKKRLLYLVEVYNLLLEKYSLESLDVIESFKNSRFSTDEEIVELKNLFLDNDLNAVLKKIFSTMDKLKKIILAKKESLPLEAIYYKRHIAVGIPSMYGQYREPKIEALGLMYRLERSASQIMNQVVGNLKLNYITGKSLRKIYEILKLFSLALELNDMKNQDFSSNLEMLDFSLKSPSFSLAQYVNIFQFMARNIKEIINEHFIRLYDETLDIVVPQIFKCDKKIAMQKEEEFYQEIMASAFLIQKLDYFVTYCITKLQGLMDTHSSQSIKSMMTYNPDLVISSFHNPTEEMDNRVFLSAKAYYLKKLNSYKFPIPPGFVLTTEIFRHREVVLDHPHMRSEIHKLIKNKVAEIESITQLKFGSCDKPLLLSVRSGTAISLPGAMSTFLNVGINDEIAEALDKNPALAWMGWDAYRRLIQSLGMSNGMNRDVFDKIMAASKLKYGVSKKASFTTEQMKGIVQEYKQALIESNINISQDPYTQLYEAITNVMNSWDSNLAQSYRKHLQIADEWGTAVIIQKMVMGNKSMKSGAGVVFTHDPKLKKPGINLYGDFTLCSQGEDVVSGLVHTLPISNSQLIEDYSSAGISLQSAFPEIYLKLEAYATELIDHLGFNNQEIEFTFESEKPDDLYILQIRDQVINAKEEISMFDFNLDMMKVLGRGIGINGGCLSGIVSFSMEDISNNKKLFPEKKHILIRPDTVPDDIPIVFLCDGLITSRGGVTSHAAVTATKLGKVCIVNCMELHVNDIELKCIINGVEICSGDVISIDGRTGNIFQGNYSIEYLKS